jgi:hypothetical protein
VLRNIAFQIKEMKAKERIIIPLPLITKKIDIRFFLVKKIMVKQRGKPIRVELVATRYIVSAQRKKK